MPEWFDAVQLTVHGLAGAVSLAAAVAAFLPRARGAHRPLLVTVAVLLAVSAALRWAIAGHPPLFGTYENSVTAATVLALGALTADLRARDGVTRRAARLLSVWVPITIGYGFLFSLTPYPLTISERSLLVEVHVALAWAAYVVLVLGSMVAARVAAGVEEDLPGADRHVVRAAGLGFALLTGMMAVGALYSWMLTAEWYPWEIVGTLTAVAWLGYAVVLHAKGLFGWSGRRLAWAMLAVLPATVAAYWVWSFYAATYHHFDITVIRAF